MHRLMLGLALAACGEVVVVGEIPAPSTVTTCTQTLAAPEPLTSFWSQAVTQPPAAHLLAVEGAAETTVLVDMPTPIVLVLFAVEPMTWRVETREAGMVSRVLVLGSAEQDVQGLEEVAVVDHPADDLSCILREGRCEVEPILRALQESLGVEFSSMAVAPRARQLVLSNGPCAGAGDE